MSRNKRSGFLTMSLAGAFMASASTGCSSDDEAARASPSGGAYSIEVADAPERLSANPSDRLCTIKLVTGASLAAKELLVTIKLPTGATSQYDNLSIEDANKNGLLDVGERLLVTEGAANTFSEIHVGQSAEVTVSRSGVALATGVWRID